MKQWATSYMSFTRTERLGMLVLLTVLFLLLVFHLSKVSFPGHGEDKSSAGQLNTAWMHRMEDHARGAGSDIVLDINIADSASLLSLKGIGPRLAQRIIARRQQLGGFNNYDEVWAIYHFPEDTRAELKQHTRIGPKTLNRGM